MRKLLQTAFLLSLCLLCCTSCHKKNRSSYQVAMDPLWYPLDFNKKDNNVIGFSTELLTEISDKEHVTLTLVPTNWDSLFEGLEQGKYQAILTSLPPYSFNRQTYDFSEPYLLLGPVLLVPIDSHYKALGEMEGKTIGALAGSSSVFLLETHANILINTYEKPTQIINDLISGKLDGALLPILQAESFAKGSFQNQLKIATPPLTNEGLRLVTLHANSPQLLNYFNEGLSKLKKSGTLETLLSEWNLIFPENNEP